MAAEPAPAAGAGRGDGFSRAHRHGARELMCGICGVAGVETDRPPLDADVLARMTGSLRHRGPDDSGHLLQPGVAIGVRRLSIIDPAGGHQPLASEDGAVWVALNGEIYNHP